MVQRRQYSSFLALSVALFFITGTAQSQGVTQQAGACATSGTLTASSNSALPIKSPEVSVDGHVVLRLCAPAATSVQVVGDWNAKSRVVDSLAKDGQGIWSISIGPLKPDFYQYSFIVDGVKAIDPSNVHSSNDALRIGSYFIVSGTDTEIALYENRDVPHGEVAAVWYSSKSVASPRRVLVYTPPNYHIGTERYPVVYLLHGWGGDENEWLEMGRTAQIMDNLLAAHRVVPMIIVMPNGHHDRHAIPDISPPPTIAELAPFPPRGYDITPSITEIAKSVVDDLVPYVDKTFRTIPHSSSRAIVGLSMGGAQATFIGLNNPDIFSWVASFSGAIVAWPGAMIPAQMSSPDGGTGPIIPQYHLNSDAIAKDLPGLNESINGKLRLLYISCGLDDGLITSNKEFENWLGARGVHFTHEEVPGYAHVWSFWRRSLVEVAPMLFH